MNDKYGLPTSYDSDLIKEYLGFADAGIASKRQAALKESSTSEMAMYDAIGRTQLQAERDIAQRRVQALRSGMTSSQLAAFEMQNLQAAQLGATEIGQQYAKERAGIMTEYAGMEDEARAGLFEILNGNVANIAAIDAEKYANSDVAIYQELFPGADPKTIDALVRRAKDPSALSSFDKSLIAEYFAELGSEEQPSYRPQDDPTYSYGWVDGKWTRRVFRSGVWVKA